MDLSSGVIHGAESESDQVFNGARVPNIIQIINVQECKLFLMEGQSGIRVLKM